MYADVLIEYPVKTLDKTFTYIIPDHLKKDIKKSILGCCPKEERKKYYKLWPETKWVSDFYSKSLKTFVFFFFMRIKLYLFCNILIDLYQRRSTN